MSLCHGSAEPAFEPAAFDPAGCAVCFGAGGLADDPHAHTTITATRWRIRTAG
jgi:hypothetical protein